MLLDPATGREIETNFPGSRFKIMEPVSTHYVHYTLSTSYIHTDIRFLQI